MKKIAIAGAGAMGGRIGSQIKEAGYDVKLIDMWEEHVNTINEKGLEIQTETDTYTLEIPAVLPHQVNETFDLVIILTKSMQAKQMLRTLYDNKAINEDTALLSMMNGLGHGDRLSAIVLKTQIFLAVTMWTAGLRGPGQLLLEGQGSIEFQRADGQADERTERINQVFNDAKLNAKISDNVFKSIWSKATLNSVLNPLCTILDKTINEFSQYEKARDIVEPLIGEIVAVAEARGVSLSAAALLDKIEAAYPNEAQGLHYPSMHQDLYNGRYTEIDYLNGQIAKYGRELGIATPNNEMLTHLIHELEMKHVK
ncbi:2-dehydropantoate 2-reductase [Staphylococcus pseudintermedius]|uniref:ketopantoate reductase family protein n=1 Tax=Staphylococcus pseudintermedius TaxID=283734 RepID=UPI0010218690|nr:2-dehydropantoate 2-reductase [Staphylococcus pseudintermedius]EIE3875815.1 2-dehydropantoate 2-reductase [Staphylococcus pseudintermedius]EIX2795035.1 2-dehydropantoate 2-reductase [Staphylococcus pseudintermedius]EJA1888377.1 2-dehydropantoate 2-reductase [Staphylococcus pseudintermedius]RYR97200.1 2-dehydropantoate 2-reductase [Staphylococcus pseudintermedius]RYS05080.1 2-dehydropantoate 2-reductase [Staphylococcus pseudintermedius]